MNLSVPKDTLDRKLSVAPMLDCTDRHCRYLLRLLSKHTLLYTEMVTTAAVIHGDRDRHLGFNSVENPLALQLGGSDPGQLAFCARQAALYGYQEVNLNCGCPSDRVQSGKFGACLMKSPELVADCVSAMSEDSALPVTVKCRIAVDDLDSYEFLSNFIEEVSSAGCKTFILHARKAWLKGLSPKQNRDIPPLDYERVYKINSDYPELEIILNGGVESISEVTTHLDKVDGVMIGRAAYQNPYLLAEADNILFQDPRSIPSRSRIIELFAEYVEQQLARGVKLSYMTRHAIGLFQGVPGARRFRRHLSEHSHQTSARADVLSKALQAMIGEEIC